MKQSANLSSDNTQSTEHQTWPPSDEVVRCPYHYFSAARDISPILKYQQTTELGGPIFLVTGHAESAQILINNKVFSSDLAGIMPGFDKSDVPPPFPDQPVFHDKQVVFFAAGNDHKIKRRWALPLVSRKRIESFKPDISLAINQLINSFIEDGSCDFRKQFSDILPILVLKIILNLPNSAVAIIRRLSISIAETDLSPTLTDEQIEEKEAAFNALFSMNRQLLEERLENPSEDYISELVATQTAEDGQLDVNTLSIQLQGIMFGGDHAVGAHLADLMVKLASNIELQSRLRKQPEDIPGFVLETLRLETPLPWLFRKCDQETLIGETTIPAGAVLVVATSAANRDSAVFEQPGDFDIDRKNLAKNFLSMGRGTHRCIGEPLALAVAQIMITEFLARMKAISLNAEQSDLGIPLSYQFRCPEKVALKFEQY